MEVPLSVALAVSLVFQAEVMSEPGANKSTQDPTLEKEDRVSEEVEEPTVRASRTREGE